MILPSLFDHAWRFFLLAFLYHRSTWYLYTVLIFIVPLSALTQTTLSISAGHLTTTNGTIITLQDANWENHATFTPGDGTIRFVGSGDNTVGGTSASTFHNLEVAKGGTTVQLNQGIRIDNELRFTTGFLDLNTHDVTLGTDGQLVNESADSRVVGSNGGELIKIQNLQAPNAINPGNLGVVCTSSANWGETEIRRGHQAQALPNGDGINRYYVITPSNNVDLAAELQFQYFTTELNGLEVPTVEAWRGTANSPIGWSYYPETSRNAAAPWVRLTNVDTLGRWTLGAPTFKLTAKVLLQGPYQNNSMRDDLRSAQVIPETEPYTDLGYTQVGGGGEKTTANVLAVTGTDAIIDWILLELRDATTPSTIIATQSALLQADGDVVATDGISPLAWPSVAAGSYYLAVRHRNHLGVMTAAVYNLNTNPTTVDFTSTAAYGNNAQVDLGGGVYGLWAGDCNGDNNLNVGDFFLSKLNTNPSVAGTYSRNDINLDGNLNVADFFLTKQRTNPSRAGQLPQ